MANAIPVGHYSQLGQQTIRSMVENDVEYINFLKYFGRVFKHPVSVALEFYSCRPDAQFIASKGQWERANYHVSLGAKGINFLDQKGSLITLYDFEDVIEEIPPKRWSITQNNVAAIRSQLNLSDDNPLFIELEGSVTSPMDDLSIIQDLGLAALPDTDKLKFRDAYHNMIQVMLTGRLEVNGAKYRIQPDRAALQYCQTDEQLFYLLTAAASAARKALTSLEYAFDTLRTQNELIRKEAKENEIRRMDTSQHGREAEGFGNGISAAQEGRSSQRNNISESREEGRSDRLASDAGSRNDEAGEVVSGDSNGNAEIGNRNNRSAISAESVRRTVYPDDSVQRTVIGGRTDRDIRQDVDGEHGEELSRNGRNDDVLPQVSDGSEVSGQESRRLLRSAERTVQQEQSASSEQFRGNSEMGGNEEIRDRTLDNDGSSSRPGNNSLSGEYTYAEYRASLRNTRFTRLDDTQKFNYSHQRYVEDPTTSIWGVVDSVVRINNGIFEVTTPSHGGIMIKAEIAKTIMSKEAQRVAQKADGWYFYEEDCDFAVVKRELLDKGLFSDIDYYFSRQYSKKIDEFIAEYNEAVNGSIQRWNSKYWDSREIALFNALSPEEQAKEIGQLSFDNDITAAADEAEVFEIRNHAIEKTMEDIRKRIERIEASNGDPDELRTQVNMLNFLQTAVESGVEITAENYKSYMADNAVDTSINGISDYSRNYFEIYQLKNDEELRYHRFTDYETLIEAGNAVEAKNYRKVYEDSLIDGTTLEDIYTRFNIAQPEDFTGHSLSVSDIIVVHDNGDTAAYYVDDIGYKRVPEFLQLQHKAENIDISSNEETAVDTSSNDNEQAIHDGFANLYANHNFTPKQKQFLERLERFSARNNVTENIIDEAFEKAAAFHNHYGNRMYVSRNTFSWRLNSIEKELVEAIQRNIAKTSVNEPITLDDVVAQFFHSGSSSVESVNGTWTINLCDDDKYAEVFHNGKAACAIYLANDKFTVRPYEELNAIPAMVTRAMKANITDSSVELLEYDRTFETPLEKAQYLINTFCESEYGDEADFSNMSSIGIAYTTITDDELPVQVTADLTNYKITYGFDGEVYNTEQYDSIEDMVENGLTGLNFDELVSVPDDVLEKHIQNTAYTPKYQSSKRGTQALISAEINGEVHNYKFTGKTVNDIMSIAKTATPLLGYDNIGSRINEVEYAEIQQSDDFTFSVELNFDNDIVSIYSVNDGQGGLSEGDRTEDSILIEEFKISEYRIPNTGLAAEKVVIDTDNAYSMWENGFTVYADNVAIQEHNDNYDKSLEIAEIFKEEKVFTAEFGDVKQQEMIDAISGEIDDLDAAMPEDNYIDIRDFVDYDEDNVFDWNNGQNVYLNITKALIERNFGFIDDYLTAVKNEYDSIRAEMAQDSLVEYANYTPPQKECNTIISVPEYGISVDLKEVDDLYLRDEYSVYEGGIDSNGHERKDNYLPQSATLTIKLNAYGNAEVEEYNSYSEFSPITNSEFDLSNEDDVTELKDKVAQFIRNAEELEVRSHKHEETHTYQVQEVAVDANSNDIEQLTAEANAVTLADVEVGDILLLREPENGEAMYFRIDSMNDNFMVSMTRVKDESGSDFTEIGLSTKSIINGRWKETLLDENDDFPIIRYTKNYQNELNSARSDKALIELPEYGISVNLKKVKSFVVEDTNYLKNNDTKCRMLVTSLKSDVVVNAKIITEGLSEHTSFNFDLKNGNDTQALKNLLSDFINNAGDLNIYSTTQDEEVYETFDITTKKANVDTSINEEITAVGTSSNEAQERSHKRASRAEMLYREFTEAYPDMANRTHTYERYGNSYDEYGDNDAFEPLSLEHLGGDTYSFMTWYIQNGDLMRDPDFVFTLDHENKELHVWEFQMDGVPGIGSLYERVEFEDGSIDKQLQASLEDTFRTNLRNAIAVKRELTAYNTENGESYELESVKKERGSQKPEINDSSAYYRETLNSFSEKHGLGELNIKNADNGFHITEKFKDGISVPMWFIAHREPTLLSTNELETELEFIEKQAERNKTTVSEMNYRPRTLKEHGGITELPMVQDDLPEINLVSDPRQKISDNNIALIELHRLRTCEENGIYPFSSGRNDYNSIENSLARLRGYSGWGGVPQLFDESFSNLKFFRDSIKERLTPEEYANARRTTLTSHYTPQVIIDAMYKTIRNMGLPKNSRILEPSCGTGNFIARMPHDIGKGGIVGVEIDSITADIAKYLNVPIDNPYADTNDEILKDKRDIKILNCGFERSGLEDNSFDLAIGNVPFGDFKLNDPDYTDDWYIHDAFFRKALDKVAPGGVVAFVTSTGTLDKKNPKIREYLATRADLIGAVRLPNNAFADAGTSTPTDIIFLQKRKELLKVHDPKPDWCYTLPVEVEMVGKKYEGEKRTAYINSYFVNNPQMVLGVIKQTTHYDMLTCEPIEGKQLKDQLDAAFRQLNAKISIEKREQSVLEKKGYIEPWGKSFTYQIKDDKILYNNGKTMEEVSAKDKKFQKMKALCELRDTTRQLLEKQVTAAIDYDLTPLRNELNAKYDQFVKDYGNITSKAITKLFRKDSDYPILAALESVDSETNKVTKADIFTRRTVNPVKEISEVDTVEEAMQISLDRKGNIDIAYIATLLRHKYGDWDIFSVMEMVADEMLDKELVYKDPEKLATGKPYAAIVDKSEYLCGDVRRKLIAAEQAAAEDSSYEKNVEALKEIIPEDIGASEISAELGCTWIDTEDYEAFIVSLSGRDTYDSRSFGVRFSEVTGQFKVDSARSRSNEIFNTNEISTYGTEDMNMYRIIENLLNQRKIQVFDYIPDPQKEGKLKSVINSHKTKIAQSKAKEIKKAFSEWIFATDERKEKYVRRYNERFNNIVGRSYDGSHLTFTGISNNFELRSHQLNCIARSIYGGNTLAAHCVGAGKSAVIAASVMKKKELGLINKACVVVPKPLTEQTEREWRKSFPDAKLFVLDNKDLSDEKKRELFTARIATGDYDAVIMSQEQFEKLPMSPEYQAEYLDKKISEMRNDLEQRKRETGRRDPSVKELESAIIKTERQVENIMNPKTKSRGKDNLLSFETLGFDYLVADEAHAYKNGFVSTKMGDVQGVSTRESGRSGDMLMKCDYFNNEFGNGHILFATGTPVSNSMTELYIMTRYLRPDLLENCGCARFDDWVATFGQIKTQNKKTATGELKLKTCFAGFKNRPELMKMYKEFADLITLDKIANNPDSRIVVPKIKNGKPQIIEVEATPEQREIVKDFAKRGRDIQLGNVRPDEDNLLKITGEARLVGLGNRAVASVYYKNNEPLPDGFLEDDKTGKIDECIKRVAEIYKNGYDKNAVQIVFSDIAVHGDNDKFSAYDYIKSELINEGIKENEIIFAPKSDAKDRADIFRDINEAKYRVVIASTGTLGTGANIQKNLYALHHLDIPWRPSDFEQREGRIVRQGNLNEEVEIFNYVTKGTLDSYLYQGVTDKARGIAQLWNDTCISRTSEDIDEKVLTFGELEAAAEGNPKLREYSELKNKIDEMQIVRAEYNRETTRIERRLKEIPEKLDAKKKLVAGAEKDLEHTKSMRTKDKMESIGIETHTGNVISDRARVNKYIADNVSKKIDRPFEDNPDFYIEGFKVSLVTTNDQARPAFAIQGERAASYQVECGVGENSDNYQRLLNFFDKGIERQIEKDTAAIEKLNLDYVQSQDRIKKPFPGEEEYNNTLKAFSDLEHELTVGGFLDNGEELTGIDDYTDYETERIKTNTNDNSDMDITEYNSI